MSAHPQLPLPRSAPRPTVPARTPTVTRIVETAGRLLDQDGPEALSMRTLAAALGVKAPSLYKHVENRTAIETLLICDALTDMGDHLHDLLDTPPARRAPVQTLLAGYREIARRRPHLYRLTTDAGFPRDLLPEGLEAWAGEPFHRATGDPVVAQALWACAHGLAVLENDERFLPGSRLDLTWAAGARAFERTDAGGAP